tara:strand:- start:4991 stop:5398 length:408 start_codon:yes stop_codon:yes gene_type:complete
MKLFMKPKRNLVTFIAISTFILFATFIMSCQVKVPIEDPFTQEEEMIERVLPDLPKPIQDEKLVKKWNTIYESRDSTYDHTVDMEVWGLREKLDKHGIDVWRVNPLNPQHQRRYKRHLSGYDKHPMTIKYRRYDI